MTNLSGVIKSIQNIMREDHGYAKRLSQLCWLLFLKIFDEKEEIIKLINSNYQLPIHRNCNNKNNTNK